MCRLRESLQCEESHICNKQRESVQYQEKVMQSEEKIVQCEEKVYSIRRATSVVRGQCVYSWRRKSTLSGISDLQCG